ncbi:MAG: chemotaxis protein CheA [Nitrospiraceae bacterium]|nr:chemotaxis protein CheA [Nitrospirota bacterium]MDA8339126.1 chemotaxis protein CheA [Nitrospiraceae bacterium]
MADEMDEIITEFVTEAEETLEKIDPMFVELEAKGYDKDILNEIFRGMHTLKGAAGFLGFQQIVDVAHRAESIMKRLRDGEIALSRELMDVILKSVDTLRLLIFHIKLKDGIEEDASGLLRELDSSLELAVSGGIQEKAEVKIEEAEKQVEAKEELKAEEIIQPEPEPKPRPQPQPVAEEQVQQITKEKEVVSTLRVDVSRIDKVMDLAGEIVLARNRLLNLASKLDLSYSGDPHVESLLETTGFLDRVTSDLQLAVMKMRMQPIQKVFGKFPRMVRDMSRNLGKDIDLEMFGEETEVDKTVIENIGDPLVHIIRNSIDHAIEFAEERESKGKPKKGRIILSAYQKGTQIVIEVSDDGKGIDVESVKKKALSKGLISEEEAQRMSDDAAINLIFLPGFSTKEVSTELSGRGVGMDVVKTNVAKLNGYVEVITKKDIGSTFRISLPLTLAIIQAMMVRIGGEYYAIPQSMIEETLRVKKSDIKDVTGQKVLTIRGKVLPMFEMSEVLGVRRGSDIDHDNSYVLVATVGDRRFCISVDELLGQEEIVIKTINGIESEECGILGATITGDGKVVLILDPAVLSRGIFKTSNK